MPPRADIRRSKRLRHEPPTGVPFRRPPKRRKSRNKNKRKQHDLSLAIATAVSEEKDAAPTYVRSTYYFSPQGEPTTALVNTFSTETTPPPTTPVDFVPTPLIVSSPSFPSAPPDFEASSVSSSSSSVLTYLVSTQPELSSPSESSSFSSYSVSSSPSYSSSSSSSSFSSSSSSSSSYSSFSSSSFSSSSSSSSSFSSSLPSHCFEPFNTPGNLPTDELAAPYSPLAEIEGRSRVDNESGCLEVNNRPLYEELERSKSENKQLRKECKEQLNRAKHAEDEKQSLLARCHNSERYNREADNTIHLLRHKLRQKGRANVDKVKEETRARQTLVDRCERYQRSAREARDEIQTLQHKLQEAETKAQQLEEARKVWEADRQSLTQHRKILRDRSTHLELLDNRVAGLTKDKQTLEDRCVHLEGAVAEGKNEIKRLTDELKRERNIVKNTIQENNELLQKYDALLRSQANIAIRPERLPTNPPPAFPVYLTSPYPMPSFSSSPPSLPPPLPSLPYLTPPYTMPLSSPSSYVSSGHYVAVPTPPTALRPESVISLPPIKL